MHRCRQHPTRPRARASPRPFLLLRCRAPPNGGSLQAAIDGARPFRIDVTVAERQLQAERARRALESHCAAPPAELEIDALRAAVVAAKGA